MPDYSRAPSRVFDIDEEVHDLQRRIRTLELDRSGTNIALNGADSGIITSPIVRAFHTSTYNAAVAQDSPLAWWPLWDKAGTGGVVEIGGSGLVGAPTNVTFGYTRSIIQNSGETSALFDGATSKIDTQCSPSGSGFTVSAWINLNNLSQGSAPVIVANDTPLSSNKGFSLFFAPGLAATGFYVGNGSSHALCTGTLTGPSASGWFHYVGTYDGSNLRLYENGILVGGPTPLAGSMAVGTNNVSIGYQPHGSSDFFAGTISHVVLYSIALPASEVLNHYQEGIAPNSNVTGQHLHYTQPPNALNLNGIFEGDNGFEPWAPWNSSDIEVGQTGNSQYGASTLVITPDGTASNPGAVSELCPIVPGIIYTVSAWTISMAGWATTQLGVNWYDVNEALISSDLGGSYALVASVGQMVSHTTALAPSTAVYGAIVVQMTGTPSAATTLEVDTAHLVRGTTAAAEILGTSLSPIAAPDQYGSAIPAGSTHRVVISGTTNDGSLGFFIYSTPQPEYDALIGSWFAQGGTDGSGNAYLGGYTVYQQLSAGAMMAIQFPFFGPVGAWGLYFYQASSPAGPYTQLGRITMPSGGQQLALLVSSLVTGFPAVVLSTEPWQSLGSTGLVGDSGTADYRFTSEGELQLSIHKSFTALGAPTTATFATVLPLAYIPVAGRLVSGDPISVVGAASAAGTRLTITGGTGAVNLVNLPTGATGVGCDVRIPLL